MRKLAGFSASLISQVLKRFNWLKGTALSLMLQVHFNIQLKSKKVALVIGHLGLWNNAMIYLSEHHANNLPNSQFPKQPLLNQLYNGSVNSMHYHPPNYDICLLSSEALVSILNSQGCEVIKLIDVQFLCSRTIFQTTYSNYYSWPLI